MQQSNVIIIKYLYKSKNIIIALLNPVLDSNAWFKIRLKIPADILPARTLAINQIVGVNTVPVSSY